MLNEMNSTTLQNRKGLRNAVTLLLIQSSNEAPRNFYFKDNPTKSSNEAPQNFYFKDNIFKPKTLFFSSSQKLFRGGWM